MRGEIALTADWNNSHSARRRNVKKHIPPFAPRRFDRHVAKGGRAFRNDQPNLQANQHGAEETSIT